jgi:hypothetical protein
MGHRNVQWVYPIVHCVADSKDFLGVNMANRLVLTTASNAVRRFTHYAAMVDAGAEEIITRRGHVPLKLVRAEIATTPDNREALVKIALAIRSAKPWKGKFIRNEAYCEERNIRRP